MKEFIMNFFFGILCGAGIMLVVEMVIVASMTFIDFIKEFKEEQKKDDSRKTSTKCD